jgi:hypothetical protein
VRKFVCLCERVRFRVCVCVWQDTLSEKERRLSKVEADLMSKLESTGGDVIELN